MGARDVESVVISRMTRFQGRLGQHALWSNSLHSLYTSEEVHTYLWCILQQAREDIGTPEGVVCNRLHLSHMHRTRIRSECYNIIRVLKNRRKIMILNTFNFALFSYFKMNITIADAFDDEDELRSLFRRLQFPVPNIDRLIREEGLSNSRILANTRVKDVETSMSTVNRLFGSHQTAARRIYFAPVRMLRVKALAVFFKRCLDANRIPDIRIIDLNVASVLVRSLDIINDSGTGVDDVIKQSKIEFSATRFTKFRQKLDTIVSSIHGCRGISLDYLIRSGDPDQDPNIPIEEASPDVYNPEFMKLNATHIGPEFQKDNNDLFTLIRHYLTGTDGWNVVSRYQRMKDGRGAYLALRSHYEGESFNDLLKSRANLMMSRTFYRGDTTKFTWEKYVSVHLEAHRMFFDAKEPLADTIKILNFKTGIRPEAGLESSIDAARAIPELKSNFEKYVNYLSEGVANRRSRKETFKSVNNQREVASYGRGGRGRGRGRGRGFGRGFGRSYNNRGRGRGRARFHSRANVPQSINVDGKTLYPSKTYSPEEYNALTNNQKDELRRARAGYQSDSYTARSISAAVSQGIREAFASNNGDDLSSVTETNNPTPSILNNPNNQRENNNNVSFNVSSAAVTPSSTDQFRSRRRRSS